MSTLQVIKLVGNDISLVNNHTQTLTDADALAQILKNKMSLWLGEWVLDTTAGIDWLGLFNQRIFLEKRIVSMLRKVLIADTRVTKISTLDVEFKRTTREITVDFEVQTIYGAVTGSI
ncbi:MAG: hypothetical protein PHX78_12500 [bacterium]|jgi:hypothetical protein|nr:hypothetical protein [bacterium]